MRPPLCGLWPGLEMENASTRRLGIGSVERRQILQADVLGRGICGIKRAASNVCTESAKLIDLSPLFRGIATAAVWTVRIARGCACASIWPSQRAHVREGGKEGGKSPPRKAGDLLFAILKKS